MLEALRSFFGRHAAPAASEPAAATTHAPIQVAACALLLELAHADDEFSDSERRHIRHALTRQFDLPEEAARDLIALAERERSEAVDLFQFASVIDEHYDEAQKMVLAEVMWGLVFADGHLSRHEISLMRKLSSLLGLRPGYLAEARRRAQVPRDGEAPAEGSQGTE